MNLNEIKKPSDQKLFEEVGKDNNTGYLTEDLVSVIRAQEGPWSAPMSADQLIMVMEGWGGGKK